MTERIGAVGYRSDKPAILEAWEFWTAAMRVHGEHLDDFRAKYNPDGKLDLYTLEHGRFAHFQGPKDVALPDGWRRNKDRRIVPDKRLKAGKLAAADVAALNSASPARVTFQGMPSQDFSGLTWMRPGTFHWDGAIYVHWSNQPNGVDLELWDELKPSELHAAWEAYQDAHNHDLAAAA